MWRKKMTDIKIQLGTWHITDIGNVVYEVEIDELSNWNGGCVSGIYSRNGEKIGYGCFSFKDMKKMEKVLTTEQCVV